ncbi:MAG: hypothetical protein HOP12_04745 [Candidatus Eisenbacteria bacterium]|uniref:R3H domain-containing protein n=1 Tax=Eiseniibacteriota bacterium TaxID=2212470 RepID=A0A849SDL3_UNCEI|nr:hypothetical protein [Candidatus Eisenbacteria bacterium]
MYAGTSESLELPHDPLEDHEVEAFDAQDELDEHLDAAEHHDDSDEDSHDDSDEDSDDDSDDDMDDEADDDMDDDSVEEAQVEEITLPERGERSTRRDRDDDRERRDRGPRMPADALRDTAVRHASELLKAMGFDAHVTGTAADDRVDLVIQVASGEELLTGRKGETRDALQHLLTRSLNRGDGAYYHLQLEINDSWKKREDELVELAHHLADAAVTTGAEQVTEFLNAQERRIIHVTLREDGRVRTQSVGDGMVKRLAVAPAHSAETSGAGS